ncbi:MAG: serine protease [Planctomycetia bacterium]
MVCLTAWTASPAAAQSGSAWEPDAFADYLLSGQTPHPAVVRIVAAENGGASLGSGVLVDANHQQGLVLTNWHVVRDTRSAVLVQFPDGFQTAGTVVRMDETWDLAAIVIWQPPATPVPLAATPPAPGDLLTIAGYGRGPYRAQTGRCTEYLSPGAGHPKEFVELAAGARQGDSGGPILNERGELAGVLFGQNSGRTIGSCSTRLRAFLTSVGSSGFTPAAAAAYADARAVERGPRATDPGATEPGATDQGPRIRMAAAAIDRQTLQAPPTSVSPAEGFGPPLEPLPEAAGQPVGQSPAAGWPTLDHLPTLEQLAPVFDVTTNGRAMLSAAGGLALAVLGLRTLFGGRRRTAVSARDTFDED